jgi:teichuronic acid biosynthesis glycosyltransferase TuaC
MNVLIVCPFFPHDTIRPYAGIFIANQARTLQKLGIQVKVVTFVPWIPWVVAIFKKNWKEFAKIPSRYLWRNIEVIVLRYPVLPRNRGLDIAMLVMEKLLHRVVIMLRPNLIHAHFAYPTGLAAARCAAQFNVPIVLTLHGSDIHTVPNLSKKYKVGVVEALKKATKVLAVSDFIRKLAFQLYERPIIVHRIGIDLSLFTPSRSSKPACFDVPQELVNVKGPVVMYIGNLLKEKGVLDLLTAFRNIANLGAHLVYIGSGPLFREIATMATQFGLNNRVWLLGAQPMERIPQLISYADVLAIPSYKEALSQAAVEALACEVPVVATNVGGIPEVVKHNETGLLITPGDVAALSEALRWMLLHKDKAKRFAMAGRHLVEKEYNLELNTRSLVEVYHDALSASCGNRNAR